MIEVNGSDVAHWAWEAFGHAFDAWEDGLPSDDPIHDLDYLERLDVFFAAHPNGWPLHPDTPKELIGTHLQAR